MALPLGVPLTVRDVWDLPDDGHRYELLEGVLMVTPAPGAVHQTCVLELAVLLRSAVGTDDLVLLAPFDWVAGPQTLLQPDLLVAHRADLAAAGDKRRDGAYVEEARVAGDEPYEAREPFAVTVVPSRLRGGL